MKITLLPGDGIGVEIVDAAVEVLDAAAKKYNFTVEYDKKLIGGAAIDAFGTPLPEETLASAKASDAVLLGAVGGPKWDNVDPSIRPEKGLLNIRKGLGLYCNLRPMKVSKYTAHLSPLKTERAEGADLLIVRELTGGIYFGTHNEAHLNADGVEEASDIEMYTRPEVERIARFAFEAARKRGGKVTSVDKANVLGSSRMWRKIVTEMRDKEYPDVELNHFYVDNCAMQLVLNPKQFDVVLTNNIFGDILSDEVSTLQLTQEEWLKLDGAEAAYPVYSAYANACYDDIAKYQYNQDTLPWQEQNKINEEFEKYVAFNNTVYAFKDLINKRCDVFFGAMPSKQQQADAAALGEELVLTPIAQEAFVFFVSSDNHVSSLTTQQVRDIYSGKTKNWQPLGGDDRRILAFQHTC